MEKDVKLQTYGPFELGSLFFRGLLKTLTTFMKFSVVATSDLITSFIEEFAEKYIPQKGSRKTSSVPWIIPEIKRKSRRT